MIIFGKALSLDQFALRNAAVLDNRLDNADTVVLQVVVDLHRSYSVVLLVRLVQGLFEVRVEQQHLVI